MPVPGSKSLTNRLVVLAALANGRSRLRAPLRSADCDGLVRAFGVLGVDGHFEADGSLVMTGAGGRPPRGGSVDLGDGGTPTRFMIAASTLAGGAVTVDGSARMRERPVAEGVEMLRSLGAEIDYPRVDGALPVRVRGRGDGAAPVGGTLSVGRTASSQFVSAAMLVAPWFAEGVTLDLGADATSRTYVALTGAVLASRGLMTEGDARALGRRGAVRATIPARSSGVEAFDVAVEPDASSAIYWFTAAAITPGASVFVPGLPPGSLQPDASLLTALEDAGAIVAAEDDGTRVTGPDGGIAGFQVDASGAPDGALALAAAAAAARTPSRITGLETLRVKESDRLSALRDELRRCGAEAEITDDSIDVVPIPGAAEGVPARDDAVAVETYDDHRIAMSFAILGLARGGISVRDPGCVEKSYPGFWADLDRWAEA